MTKEKGDHSDMVLGPRHLLGVFFLVVLLCAIFFTLGYVLGRTQAAPQKALVSPPKAPAADASTPSTDLTFYQHVEGKPAPGNLPAQPEKQPAPASATAAKAEPIYLQVAAVTQEAEAKRLAQRLLELGFPSVIRPPRDDRFYRVQVGPLETSELADAAQRRLEAQGFRAIVRR